MNKSVFFLLITVVLFFGSCISTRDLNYLQYKKGTSSESAISLVASKPYRVQIADVLSLSIKAIDPKLVSIFSTVEGEVGKSPSALYFDGFTVDDHGNIRIPVLGEMNVIGYTTEEIRLRIEKQLLSEYFNKEANLFVTVKLAGFKYTITGEIGSTGTKTVFQDRLTIMEAVANSGDITITGNRKAVTIMRQSPTGVEMHDLDLTDINVMKSPYYYLQPNDFIFVKPLKQKTWGTGKTGLESITTFVSLLSLASTMFLLLTN
ncbi:polysaccharide biosynthesis/export family protein [Flavobacterium algicola]|uniref:polysaccharide biosynthesis/export family protein n=1 Tax=Flavobacterium algicola TaxID=556529 RepID=UPI001EFD76A3|nr:polysaccharide biosynthesis/export family protein [Flavobacterium algicola]MCG9793942.1 polysaccharide biosynthesis/export family protein [Flavobacterium algicola]